MKSIYIIKYNSCNALSMQNILAYSGFDSTIVEFPHQLSEPSSIILPGVGSYDAGRSALAERGFDKILSELHQKGKTQIIGVCLGMQLLSESSTEGTSKGLGLLPGKFVQFVNRPDYPRPHMGWNSVKLTKDINCLRANNEVGRYYFSHSYYSNDVPEDNVLALTNYGFDFPVIVKNKNTIGIQFHPEKSHKYGVSLLKSILGGDD